MSCPGIRVKCKKCHCIISVESNGRLCDNCNMDLIAQNLAAEFYQHEIHRQDNENTEIDHPMEISENSNQILKNTDEAKSTSNEIETDDFVSSEIHNTEENDSNILSHSRIEDTGSMKLEKLDDKYDSKPELKTLNAEEYIDEINATEPSTSSCTTTRSSERRISNDRKRKLDESVDIVDKSSKCRDEESSDDDDKKPDVKPEPMRTRAKVVQEEAAAQNRHHDVIIDDDKAGDNDEVEEEDDGKGPLRRLTRKALSEIEKYKHPAYEPAQTKSRRTKTFKAKPVYKAPTSQARIYSSDYVFYKGRYYQTGDVVVLRDCRRPGDYFAQITSFLTDQYCHKCATIQWLFPTKQSPETGFDPRTYFLGYLDETPRPLSALQPVMHLPSDYYMFNKTPYPPPTPDPLKKHYLWKRTEPVSLETLLQGQ